MKKIKMLNRLIERLENLKVRSYDPYMSGVNDGLNSAIHVLKDKIADIEKVDE